MLQRKCPKCDKGVMSDLYTSRGWGVDGAYVCDSCGHLKNIYEGTTIAPYIFFILFEVIIFFLEDRVSFFEYVVYGIIFIFLVYRVYKAQMRDSMIENEYPLIEDYKGEFQPTKIQEESLEIYMKKTLNNARIIKAIIAIIIFISYSIMFYFQESLGYIDYISYFVIAIALPLWLILTKFEGE